jgi:hypothetical protein
MRKARFSALLTVCSRIRQSKARRAARAWTVAYGDFPIDDKFSDERIAATQARAERSCASRALGRSGCEVSALTFVLFGDGMRAMRKLRKALA